MQLHRSPASIAFLGTGLMGAPMARRLLIAGHHVSVWNRTAAKAAALAADGAHILTDPIVAAAAATVVITMLADGPVVTQMLFARGVAKAMQAGSLVIDMSSIAPALAREHAVHLASLGIRHLDAPVSGGTKGAAEGTLAIMAGGDADTFDAARPLLQAMGRPTHVGPSGSGQLAKLANQTIVALTIGAVAEALVLAAAGGADPARVREALTGGFADSAILRQHGQRMLDRSWVPGGPIRAQIKDLDTVHDLARALRLELPLTETVRQLFASASKGGLQGHDHSALLLEIERRNPRVRVGQALDQHP